MSGLPMWASRLLFTWQLLWLLVQAAPARPVALDTVLLTSIPPGPTEPWPLDQQTPPMNSFMAEDLESFLLNPDSSALPAEVPEETEAFPTPLESPAHQPEDLEVGEPSSTQEDTSAQSAVSPQLDQSVQIFDGLSDQHPTSSENVDFSVQEKSSALPQLPTASVGPPSVQPKGPALPPKSSVNQEVTLSPLDSGEAQHPVLSYLNIRNVGVGVLVTPKHPRKTKPSETEKEASAAKSTEMVKLPIQLGVPPKAPEKTELSLIQSTPEGDAIQLQQTTAPSQYPMVTFLHSDPIQAQQPTLTDVTLPSLNLDLTIIPEPTVEAEHLTMLKKTTPPPNQPEVTFPHPEPVQAQQSSSTDVTVPPLDLELTITPEPTVEAEHHTTLRKPTAPPKHPEETFPHPEPVQAQQPTLTDVTLPSLNLDLTIIPEPTVEAEHLTTLKKTTAPPKQPEETFPQPDAVKAQQPSSTDVTVPPLDLELTITPEPTVEAEHPIPLWQTAAPPSHPQVTFPQPEPIQAQQPTLTDVTLPSLNLDLTIIPEPTVEAEHLTTLKKTTPPPNQPEVTFPHPEPVQAQQSSSTDVTVPPLDLELTITPEPTVEAEHHTTLRKTTAPPKHPEETFPHPEPVQAQQPTLTDVTLPSLNLDLTIIPEPTVEAEHLTTLKKTTAPPKQPEVTFPHPEPVQAQQPSSTDVTVPPLDLELTITPEPTVEAEHPIPLWQTAAPPSHPQVTFPQPEPIQAQQPTLTDVTLPSLNLDLTIIPEPTVEAEHLTMLKKTTAPPNQPEVTFPHPEPVQAQQSSSTDVTVPPLDLELTITPEPTVQTEHPVTLRKTIAPPKQREETFPQPERVQAQQPSLTDVTVPSLNLDLTIIPAPNQPEVTFPHPEPVQAQQPTLTDVTLPSLNLDLTIIPEPTVEAEHLTMLKKTTAPPNQPKVTFPHPEPVQAQQPSLTDVTVPPLDLELTITPESTVEAEHPIPLWQTAAPPSHPQVAFPQPEPVQAQQQIFSDVRVPPLFLELTIKREDAAQAEQRTTLKKTTASPKKPQVTLPHPEPVPAQQTTFSDVRVPRLNLDFTATPEPSVGAEHARALQQTTAPPTHPLVTFLVQHQQSTLSEVTGHGSDLEFITTQQPETSESGPPGNEQNAIMNICELCTCKNETLSCTGLSSKQKLHGVPVLSPEIYNGSFTILNFKGNSISYIDKDTWESYRWVEKLILSENNLRELHKDSFEGLLSLQYLDLSSNKIQVIERNAFEFMPFLQYINLHNNLITNVRFGTFQAWHGMQFLHKLILSHNPLTTVEDSYLFKLPALRYLDMGTTQVSLTTVESILLMALKLQKLILPSHLACCLCQFKSNIEAVSKTVKLHCDAECLTNTQCDEELYLRDAEVSLMEVLQGREKHSSTELTIEPERTSSGEEKGGRLSAFMNLLMKLLTEQEEVKVSKADWDTGHWGNERAEAQGEEEEQESRELTEVVPGYRYKNKLILAAPVIGVATTFTVIFCLMAICQRRTAEDGKEGRGFFSIFLPKSLSPEHEMEEGGFQGRRPLWLWDMYWPLNFMRKRNVEQKLQDDMSDEGELLEKTEKGEASTSTAKGAASESAAEETAEESDA